MNTEREPASDIRRYRRLASIIVRKHFGQDASRIVYKPSGKTNYVFAVNHVQGQFVIRISPDPQRLEIFRKELWTTEQARAKGVPTPEILIVSSGPSAEPYMISRRVSGSEATHHEKRRSIINKMGEYAALINAIPTNNFGSYFDWAEHPIKQQTWREYLENDWNIQERLTVFERQQLLSSSQLTALRKILEQAKGIDAQPSLSHGDFRLKNVIVDDDGEITAIIDWEESISTLASQWEFSIALHDLSIDEKHSFIEGYGLSPNQVQEMAPLFKAMNILNYASAIERAVVEQDDKRLAQFKLRFSGSLDLYCL